jgi:hypothetical protein
MAVCGGVAFFCFDGVPVLGDGKETEAAVVSTVGMFFNRHFDFTSGYQAGANSILSKGLEDRPCRLEARF